MQRKENSLPYRPQDRSCSKWLKDYHDGSRAEDASGAEVKRGLHALRPEDAAGTALALSASNALDMACKSSNALRKFASHASAHDVA
jgi:hypothetical protein